MPAPQDVTVSHGFHSQHSDALFHQLWKYIVSEAPEVRIHDVKRHLAGIKMETMLGRRLQHPEMYEWILMAGEAYVANLPGLLCLHQRLKRAVRSKEPVGIFQANVFVILDEIDMVCLQALQ